MTLIIRGEQPSHWYTKAGKAFYEIEKKDGTGMRPTTLRDARKVGALPSVTNILSCLARPGLEAWKCEQAILSALTLPRHPGETLDAFAHRIVEDKDEQVAKASDLGTRIHAAAEAYATERYVPTDPAVVPIFEPFKKWFDENVDGVHAIEKIVVGKGYAGKIDMVGNIRNFGMCMIDFKSQTIGKSGKPNFYETWALQLEAYREAYNYGFPMVYAQKSLSVVIGTNQKGVWVHEWPQSEQVATWNAFLAAFQCWTWLKGYDPTLELIASMKWYSVESFDGEPHGLFCENCASNILNPVEVKNPDPIKSCCRCGKLVKNPEEKS